MHLHVADSRGGVELDAIAVPIVHQRLEIERVGDHGQLAAAHWPRIARPVAVDLDAVAVRVAEIQRLADAVVARAAERVAPSGEGCERAAERRAAGHQDGEVVQPGGALRLGASAWQLGQRQQRPRRRPERRALVGMLAQLHPRDLGVEPQRARQIGHRQRHMSDMGHR